MRLRVGQRQIMKRLIDHRKVRGFYSKSDGKSLHLEGLDQGGKVDSLHARNIFSNESRAAGYQENS